VTTHPFHKDHSAYCVVSLSIQNHNVDEKACFPVSHVVGILQRSGLLPLTIVFEAITTILDSRPFGRRNIIGLHVLLRALKLQVCRHPIEQEFLERNHNHLANVAINRFMTSPDIPVEDKVHEPFVDFRGPPESLDGRIATLP